MVSKLTKPQLFSPTTDAFAQLQALERTAFQKHKKFGFRHSEVVKLFKQLINKWNSQAILLLQQDKHHEAMKVMQICTRADNAMYEQGDLVNKLWPGRLVTFSTFAYLFQRMGDMHGWLKFMLDAQSLMFSNSKAGEGIGANEQILTNLWTFYTLWKIKKFKESQTYWELWNKLYETTSDIPLPNVSANGRLTLYTIIQLGKAALHHKINNDGEGAMQMWQLLLNKLKGRHLDVEQCVRSYIEGLYSQIVTQGKQLDLQDLSSPSMRKAARLPRLISARDHDVDYLTTPMFERIFFEAAFGPFIVRRKKPKSLGNPGNSKATNKAKVNMTTMHALPKRNASSRKHMKHSSIDIPRKSLEEDFLSNIHTAQYIRTRKPISTAMSAAMSPAMRLRSSEAHNHSLLVEFSPRQSENDDFKVILQPFNERK